MALTLITALNLYESKDGCNGGGGEGSGWVLRDFRANGIVLFLEGAERDDRDSDFTVKALAALIVDLLRVGGKDGLMSSMRKLDRGVGADAASVVEEAEDLLVRVGPSGVSGVDGVLAPQNLESGLVIVGGLEVFGCTWKVRDEGDEESPAEAGLGLRDILSGGTTSMSSISQSSSMACRR